MMRAQILTTTAISALLLGACGDQDGAGYEEVQPGDQAATESLTDTQAESPTDIEIDPAESGTQQQDADGTMAGETAATDTGADIGMGSDPGTATQTTDVEVQTSISGFYGSALLLDFTQGVGVPPAAVPDTLTWEAGNNAAVLSGEPAEAPTSNAMTDGVAFEVPRETASSLAGRTVEVAIIASADTMTEFDVAYSTNDGADSGWRSFEASEIPQTFTFEYNVPNGELESAHYIGLLPAGDGPVMIHAIAVRAYGAAQ